MDIRTKNANVGHEAQIGSISDEAVFYRTQETQQGLYDNKVQRLVDSGMSEEEAKVEAAKAVAIPGTSEHQLGLAVDIVDANMQDLTDEQENTATQKWLMANSWRYGFIHRYPNGKTDITRQTSASSKPWQKDWKCPKKK